MTDERAKPGAADEHIVEELLTRLTSVPNDARSFDVTVEEASRLYPVGVRFLDRVRARGLCEEQEGTELFERTDLINVELFLGRGAATMSLRRFWPATLKRVQAPAPAGYLVEFRAACPDPGHPGDCEYSLVLPGGRQQVRVERSASERPIAHVRVECPTEWPDLPESAREIIDELCGVTFVRLPWKLGHVLDDIAFVRRTGLGDCEAATKLLVKCGAERGVPIRQSFGLMLAPPFALKHYWPEVLVDDVWVPIEPLLMKAMVEWRALDPAQWAPYRSPGAALWRRAVEWWDVSVRHNGKVVEASYRAEVVPDPSCGPSGQTHRLVGQ
ncbi:transglutaminase domain-containing protein [Dactylosporangium sp. NPDC051485]|uniref:transglutaminase domain-containing protein n=1 Tax=Dactylosporangium sp. NPDC051485 TaxID=3154846 RepID=UPI003419AD4B